MRLGFRSIIALSSVLVLSACSDGGSNSSSTTTSIEGWVGAQSFNSAQVIANPVDEAGQSSRDINGIYSGIRESSDSQSKYSAVITINESTLLIARGQVADVDKDKNNEATQQLCQLMAGCEVSGSTIAFNSYYPSTSGFEYKSIVYNPDGGSRNNINAVTTLSSVFAYEYDVKNSTVNGAFTAYDIVLGNSQLSNLLGLSDVIGDLPVNLARLDSLDGANSGTKNQIRYGALLSGLQYLELLYNANNTEVNAESFISKASAEYSQDMGQLYYHTPAVSRELTLQSFYQASHDNLESIVPTLENASVKALASQVVDDLKAEIDAAAAQPENTKTTSIADDLSTLLTAEEITDFNVGLEKTKLFVSSLQDFQNTLWTEGYQQEIDAYIAQLETISDTHKDNLNALAAEFARIQSYYVTCVIGGELCDETPENGGFSDFKDRDTQYDEATKVLTIDSGKVTVSQALADLNIISSADVTESHAVDVLITGTLEINNLVLILKHDLNSDETEIDIPSAMRIYYTEAVTEVRADLVISGYELIWGDFQLYDKTSVGTSTETDLAGAFRIFYRGVQDPQNTNTPNDSELRFNIENWLLNSAITDTVDTDADNNDTATLAISAQATNPDSYYPSKKMASFNGFFEPNNSHAVGDVESGLLSYKQSTELVDFGTASVEVETVDFINALGADTRYRFYPDEQVVDKNDSNGNGNVDELVDIHRVEECELKKGTTTVVKCGPRTRIYEKRDIQKTINSLWELGLFQITEVDGRGSYFVDFPTVMDGQGCLVLQPLDEEKTMDGSLLERQVLGLDSVRVVSEISLQNDEGAALPKTLLDLTVVAPKEDKYRVNAALSHNYTATTADANNNAVGTGTNVSVVRVSYDTSADFENTGNLSVIKGGVQLTLGDGSTVTEDQSLTSYLSETFNAENVNYTIVENEEGVAERCVKSVGSIYVKDPADIENVLYLNYRGVLYATARPEDGVWVIRYIDGTFSIPFAES